MKYCKFYIPKRNKKKLLIIGILAIPFLVTPFTNWIYFLGIKTLFKLNPVWVYV